METILETVTYYYPSVLGICWGTIILIIGIYLLIKFCITKKHATSFIILSAFFLIMGSLTITFAYDKTFSYFSRKPYYEYTILTDSNTDWKFLIENFTFDEQLYPDIWRITTRK